MKLTMNCPSSQWHGKEIVEVEKRRHSDFEWTATLVDGVKLRVYGDEILVSA